MLPVRVCNEVTIGCGDETTKTHPPQPDAVVGRAAVKECPALIVTLPEVLMLMLDNESGAAEVMVTLFPVTVTLPPCCCMLVITEGDITVAEGVVNVVPG